MSNIKAYKSRVEGCGLAVFLDGAAWLNTLKFFITPPTTAAWSPWATEALMVFVRLSLVTSPVN